MFYFEWIDAIKILAFSTASMLWLFIIARLMGKKQIAELNFIDYVIGISLGSIAAEMSIDLNNNPIWYYIIAMTTFLFVDVIITFIEKKSPHFKNLFEGKSSVLIYQGKINYKELKKTRITVNDLLSMARANGYFDIKDIAYAILETSGELSVLPNGKEKNVTVADLLYPKIRQASLPCYLVIDGKISYSALNEISKDKDWLLKKLNCKKEKQLKEFILVEYDNKTKEITIHSKKDYI